MGVRYLLGHVALVESMAVPQVMRREGHLQGAQKQVTVSADANLQTDVPDGYPSAAVSSMIALNDTSNLLADSAIADMVKALTTHATSSDTVAKSSSIIAGLLKKTASGEPNDTNVTSNRQLRDVIPGGADGAFETNPSTVATSNEVLSPISELSRSMNMRNDSESPNATASSDGESGNGTNSSAASSEENDDGSEIKLGAKSKASAQKKSVSTKRSIADKVAAMNSENNQKQTNTLIAEASTKADQAMADTKENIPKFKDDITKRLNPTSGYTVDIAEKERITKTVDCLQKYADTLMNDIADKYSHDKEVADKFNEVYSKETALSNYVSGTPAHLKDEDVQKKFNAELESDVATFNEDVEAISALVVKIRGCGQQVHSVTYAAERQESGGATLPRADLSSVKCELPPGTSCDEGTAAAAAEDTSSSSSGGSMKAVFITGSVIGVLCIATVGVTLARRRAAAASGGAGGR